MGATAFAQGISSHGTVGSSQSTAVSAGPAGARAESNTSAQVDQQANAGNAKHDSGKDQHAQKSDAAASGQLASGTTLQVMLLKPLDARKNKPGEAIVARTTATAKSASGVVIPKGSQVFGHVTRASARSKGESESALGLAFDRAVLKDGSQVPLNVAVQAVAAAQSATAMDMGNEAMASGSAMTSGAANAGGGLLGGVDAGAGVLTNAGAGLGSSVGQ